jgi:hypothetical protein
MVIAATNIIWFAEDLQTDGQLEVFLWLDSESVFSRPVKHSFV